MMLEEMQARCKKAKVTTQDELWAVSPIYCLLNFDSTGGFRCHFRHVFGPPFALSWKWQERREDTEKTLFGPNLAPVMTLNGALRVKKISSFWYLSARLIRSPTLSDGSFSPVSIWE